jgi:hypothetical protein
MNFVWRCVIRAESFRRPLDGWWSECFATDPPLVQVTGYWWIDHHGGHADNVDEPQGRFIYIQWKELDVSTISTLETFHLMNFKLSDRNRWRFAVHFIVETSDIDSRRLINAGHKLFPVERGRHGTTSRDQLGGISRRINCWPNYHTTATMVERFVIGGRAAQFACQVICR